MPTDTMSLPPIEHVPFSYWANKPSELANFKSSESLPEAVNCVVIGSGLSGTSTAFHLLEEGIDDVVILEARQVCSGATGRNGGHLAPFPFHTVIPGSAEAFERLNHIALLDLIAKYSIECNINTDKDCIGWQIYEDKHAFKSAKDRIAFLKKLLKDEDGKNEWLDQMKILTEKEALDKLSFNHTKDTIGERPRIYGAITYPATPLNPYLLVNALLRECLKKGMRLYTNTPVTSLQPTGEDQWLVATEQGTILANKVYVCTNAYTFNLLDQVAVRPTRGQICRWEFAKDKLKSWPLDNERVSLDFDQEYIVVLPTGPDKYSVVFGGCRRFAPGEEVGIVDDNSLSEEVSFRLRKMAREKLGIVDEPVQEWSGIMGFASEGEPMVGRPTISKSLFLSAGFTGHGLPRIFLSSKALVTYSLTKDYPEWFPEVYQMNDGLRKVNLTKSSWSLCSIS